LQTFSVLVGIDLKVLASDLLLWSVMLPFRLRIQP